MTKSSKLNQALSALGLGLIGFGFIGSSLLVPYLAYPALAEMNPPPSFLQSIPGDILAHVQRPPFTLMQAWVGFFIFFLSSLLGFVLTWGSGKEDRKNLRRVRKKPTLDGATKTFTLDGELNLSEVDLAFGEAAEVDGISKWSSPDL